MELIENKNYDEERALYNIKNTVVKNCIFAGTKDGESVLKETRNIIVNNCKFSLRYPMWHVEKYELINSEFDERTRASLWYSNNGTIKNTNITGVKALRECDNTIISDCKIKSVEFGWKTNATELNNTEIESEYIFLDSKNIKLNNVKFKGKYSFQYTENVEIINSILDTKEAFWHSKNVTVRDSVIKGEYLAWFSDGLTLINCKIIGTQPLCYCKKLKLINCKTEECDLSFEYSEVDADINGNIISIKNPKSGVIKVDSVNEVINENSIMKVDGKVIYKNGSESNE